MTDNNKHSKTENFINKARNIHGDTYGYEEVEYINAHTRISIVCSRHGEFKTTPTSHLAGSGCKQCSMELLWSKSKLTQDEFVSRSSALHNNYYNYSRVEYRTSQDKVSIICPLHGEFTQSARSHLKGHGCKKCANSKSSDNRSLKIAKFLKDSVKSHGTKYDYSLVDIVCAKTKVKIICPSHGLFEQEPRHHMVGRGCVQCASLFLGDLHRKSNEDYIADAVSVHGDTYDYSEVEYMGAENKVKISCKQHGVFEQQAQSHLSGRGCPSCGRLGGFNQMLDAVFYVLKCGNITKIGITNKTADYRAKYISSSFGGKFEVVKEYAGSGPHILDTETHLLKELRAMYASPITKFEGYTECFYDVDIPHLINKIELALTQRELYEEKRTTPYIWPV